MEIKNKTIHNEAKHDVGKHSRQLENAIKNIDLGHTKIIVLCFQSTH